MSYMLFACFLFKKKKKNNILARLGRFDWILKFLFPQIFTHFTLRRTSGDVVVQQAGDSSSLGNCGCVVIGSLGR